LFRQRLLFGILVFLTGCFFLASPVFGSRFKVGDKAVDPSIEFDGLLIDSIVIENRNIYNTSEKRYDNFIFKTANKLHFVTRASVIRRELLFHVGDPYSSALAEEIGRNLRTRYVLYDAWVVPELLPDGKLLVRVVTIDQWSLLGGLTIRRDGNETNYQIGFEEKNFLGYNQLVTCDYFVQENDDNFFRTSFIDERFRGKALYVDLIYSNQPTDKIKQIGVSRPYYNLNQNFSFGFTYLSRGGRRDIYDDEIKKAQSYNTGDITKIYLGYRWGEYTKKIGINLYYDYHYENTYDRFLYDPDFTVVFPEDTVYHQFTFGIPLENIDFIVLKRINGFNYSEDITLGESFELSYGRAFEPDFRNHLFDEVSLQSAYTIYVRANLISVGYNRQVKFRWDQDLRHISQFVLKYYNNGPSFFTLAFRALYLSDWRVEGTSDLLFGGSNYLRGYDKYFRTGDRLNVFNLEGRFYSNLELLSAIFGGAVFADLGRTWKAGEPLRVEDYFWSVGAGLRISFEKATKSKILRLDLALREDKKLEFSIGTGQFF
jgi:hypothetical protein